MPDKPPCLLINRDNDENDFAPVAYSFRQNFETDEIERLTAQLDAARLAYNETRQALILDNPSGGYLAFAPVRAALERIGRALGELE